MEQRRFVVLDRDGTINIEREYLSNPNDIELLPGTASGLRHLSKIGLGLVVVTNQSAIGRGFFGLARLALIHQRLCELLKNEGISLDGIYFCPHVPEDDCLCRKPKPGLLKQAVQEFEFDPQTCFVIGDKACDIELGQQVRATTFLVRTGYGAQVADEGIVGPDYVVNNLDGAARIIERLLAEEQRGFVAGK